MDGSLLMIDYEYWVVERKVLIGEIWDGVVFKDVGNYLEIILGNMDVLGGLDLW